MTLDQFAKSKLDLLRERGLLRQLETTDRLPNCRVHRGDQTLVSFCSNDYLNLTQHAAVKAAAMRAVERFGAGAGASRLITGNSPLYETLESRLAAVKGTEAAVVFGSGYLANIGVVPTLVGREDLILIDELSHNCLHAGAQLSAAEVYAYPHNDLADVESVLQRRRAAFRRCLIATDGVFSMDGDLAPIPGLCELARRYEAWLLTDDAHGLGVMGDGRGSAAELGCDGVALQMGTLSKALGSYGGYLCASTPVVDLIRTRARSLIYTTGLPPAALATAIASLGLISCDRALVARPIANARRFAAALGLREPQSPIVPWIVGDVGRAVDMASQLESAGFLITPIRPPTVPEGTARLRFTFTAGHTNDDISGLVQACQRIGVNGRRGHVAP